jgi:hypothetical protein
MSSLIPHCHGLHKEREDIMLVQLLVERDQNECTVKLAGRAYKFKRNEHGHLVSDITDYDHIKWVSDPTHNTSFKLYSAPKKKIIEEVNDEVVVGKVVEEVVETPVAVTEEPDPGAVAETESDLPPYPQKGSKRPPKRSEG